ncbi:nodal modulator 1 isoform X2 [Lucilia sericata]|uniref:nodal modulator 1 isoform X2 n=1 Tax=Lucilia sericata TaxID=13632 RepID=UPI0018A7F00C|nr:nodal modulator 1 isoform X2 [Lucilia sericata]
MRVLGNIFLVLLIKLLSLIGNVELNEVIGCGGFIKSHADIDFSKVEVKLLTKQGALKDKTDCSPSNGYYFLPIYDKGEYLLKISPPPGWSFEPEEVKLNFNGQTDICSLGKDVNFVFKGFGITGKVALGSGGAKGVKVELKSEDGKDVRETTTDVNGIFSFTPIIPGKYLVKATHDQWYFEKAEYTVVVEGGNTVLPENSLVVSGFDVTGRFETSGQLNSGVGIALFESKSNSSPLRCSKKELKNSVTNTVANYKDSPACYALVDKNGDYIFKDVAPGKYLLQPVIEDVNLKLNLKPSYVEFEVTKDTLDLKQEFKITGFSVNGQVLDGPQGSPISKAIVKLNGQKEVVTDNKGFFVLDSVNAGTYTLQVQADKYEFAEQRVKLQLTVPSLPATVPSAYEVCGKVVAKKSYKVGITKQGSTFHTTANTDAESGVWCAYLPSGKFSIEVLTTDSDKSNGVQFFPVQQTIEVISQPLKDIVFSQLRATLQGKLRCLPDAPLAACLKTEVTLHNLDANGQLTGQKQTTTAEDGKYSFKNVLPGPYEITVPQSNLCFDSTRVLINVASASETAPDFVQHGYEVNIISSHRAIMKYSHSSASSSDSFKLLSGVNTFCVPKFGSYKIKLEGCHLYNDNELPSTFDTSNTNPIIINAKAHKVGVRVLSPDSSVDSLQLTVESTTLGKQVVKPIAESHKVDGKYAYRFETHLKPEEVLRITPKSDILLFEPTTKEIVGTNDCVDVAFNFIASEGLILRGKVVPAIKDAKITLSFPKNPELTSETSLTSASGEFKFGPIKDSLYYELKGEKESYVFSDYNPSTNSFSVHKLCEIIVKVVDESNKGLAGVLVSLSGSESYRKNLITSDDGSINFHSLSPSQYFLRPMLKEFKFEPNSKMIDLKDGETVEIKMIGKRVAYSAFGTVTSLNGEPFAQVNIEATASEKCSHHQEEATTENNGKYRLRGLNPGCDYTIRVKDAGVAGNNVDRSIPVQRVVEIANEDVQNVNFLAISPINFVDVTVRVTAASNDFYKTLRLVMYRKGSYDSPIYSQRLETPLNPKARYNPGIMVFLPRIPLDGKTYIVELRSSLSDKTYTYTVPTQQFVADTGSVFVELDFTPEVKSYETDLNQNSISALILVALVSIAFFKQDIAVGFLDFVWTKISAIADDFAQKQKNQAKNNVRKVEPINQKEIEQMAEQINNIKKKKTKKI